MLAACWCGPRLGSGVLAAADQGAACGSSPQPGLIRSITNYHRPAPRHCDTQQLVTTAGTNPALWRQCLAPAPALFCCPGRVCTSECPTTAAANHRRRRGLCCRSPHQRHGPSSAAVGVALCGISHVATVTWTIVQVYNKYFISKQKNPRKRCIY